LLAAGCASIPRGQYGVTSIEIIGMRDMEPEALESCLVTKERERWSLRLGLGAPSCGNPPFDSAAPVIKLFSMPWSEWPIYDPAIFEVEKERIERWYEARGYFDAKVTSVKTLVDGKPVNPDECKTSDCKLEIVVTLKEGKPTYVSDVELESTTPLPAALMDRLKRNLQLKRNVRFDESSYNADKDMLEEKLIAAAYARAKVSGSVKIDRNTRMAVVQYKLDPGPECVFGKVTVEGAEDVPVPLIIETANIHEGAKFDQDDVEDAQRSIFALRVFSSVRIDRRGEGRVVDLAITLQRGRITTWSAGLGVMSGTLRRVTSDETNSVPQWDVHLSGSYENRNLLGGLRQLRLEERPRLIFLREFPRAPAPRLGNLISAKFEQPATLEARTTFFSSAAWDVGPDPFRGFFRHDIAVKAGFRRSFWRRRFTASLAAEQDFYRVERDPMTPLDVSSYTLPFLEQELALDLRNDARRPRLGAYFKVLVQETSRLGGYGSWDYVRVLPDARVYVPLFWDVVLAARFAVGALLVFNAAPFLDPTTSGLGPEAYRLRGGGANSDRGFAAGQLGDGTIGGSMRYEGSLELRIPLGGDFGLVGFGDVGDVHTKIDFHHLNAATGFGLRYHSIIGALRLDFGWRLAALEWIGHPRWVNEGQEPAGRNGWPSAIHLTIGEAF
jgi:outer membrane protein assembly factor BamA